MVTQITRSRWWAEASEGRPVPHRHRAMKVVAGAEPKVPLRPLIVSLSNKRKRPRSLPVSKAKTGEPPGRPAVERGCDHVHLVTGPRKHPCHEGVRVPHVTRAELVSPPGQRRDLGQQRQNSSYLSRIPCNPARPADSFLEVRDGPAGPAPDFIAEGAGPAERTRSDRPLADDAATRCGNVPHWSHLDRVAHAVVLDLQGGVVQVAPGSSLSSRDDTLIDSAVPADTPPARTERKPVQVDPRRVHVSDPRRRVRAPSSRAAGPAAGEERRHCPRRE